MCVQCGKGEYIEDHEAETNICSHCGQRFIYISPETIADVKALREYDEQKALHLINTDDISYTINDNKIEIWLKITVIDPRI